MLSPVNEQNLTGYGILFKEKKYRLGNVPDSGPATQRDGLDACIQDGFIFTGGR
jgi:hypothetical protein